MVPMDREMEDGLAVGSGDQDHGALELQARRNPAVGWVATAERPSGGISRRRCRYLLCSPVAAPCQLPSPPVVMSQANLPSFLLSSWDYFFSSFFGKNNAGGQGKPPGSRLASLCSVTGSQAFRGVCFSGMLDQDGSRMVQQAQKPHENLGFFFFLFWLDFAFQTQFDLI